MLGKIKKYVKLKAQKLSILFQFFLTKKLKDKRRIVVFDIKNPSVFSRHLVAPSLFFVRNGYTVYYRLRINLLKLFGYYYRLVSSNPNVKLAFKPPKNYTFYFTNDPNENDSIIIKPDLFGLEVYKKNSFRFPPSMHPLLYTNPIFERSQKVRNQPLPRKYILAFAGSLNINDYKSFQWGQDFFINRVQLVKKIIEDFPDQVFIPKTKTEFRNNEGATICIVDRSNFSLEICEYLKLLKMSWFSLCPPGVKVPFSHNLIETMYMGSIPILQYGDLLSPSLKEEKHCLAYSDKRSFNLTLKKAFQMEEREKMRMVENVQQYYSDYLNPESAISNLEKSLSRGTDTIYIWQESNG